MEIKRGKDGRWHPHLHIIAQGRFYPQHELAEDWRKASGTSLIADIRAIRNADVAMRYVTKYVSNGIDASLIDDPKSLDEYIAATKGQRTYNALGDWKAPDDNDAEPLRWKSISTLPEWHSALARCEPWAIALALQLHRDPNDITQRARNPDQDIGPQ